MWDILAYFDEKGLILKSSVLLMEESDYFFKKT